LVRKKKEKFFEMKSKILNILNLLLNFIKFNINMAILYTSFIT